MSDKPEKPGTYYDARAGRTLEITDDGWSSERFMEASGSTPTETAMLLDKELSDIDDRFELVKSRLRLLVRRVKAPADIRPEDLAIMRFDRMASELGPIDAGHLYQARRLAGALFADSSMRDPEAMQALRELEMCDGAIAFTWRLAVHGPRDVQWLVYPSDMPWPAVRVRVHLSGMFGEELASHFARSRTYWLASVVIEETRRWLTNA